jgi:hypothetical protein
MTSLYVHVRPIFFSMTADTEPPGPRSMKKIFRPSSLNESCCMRHSKFGFLSAADGRESSMD